MKPLAYREQRLSEHLQDRGYSPIASPVNQVLVLFSNAQVDNIAEKRPGLNVDLALLNGSFDFGYCMSDEAGAITNAKEARAVLLKFRDGVFSLIGSPGPKVAYPIVPQLVFVKSSVIRATEGDTLRLSA